MLIPTFGRHLLKFWVEIKKLEKPRWAKWNSFCWLLQWTSMNRRQIFSFHIVLKCQRSSATQTFARLQYFCTFVIEIKDRMQYCMEEPKRGCRARALSIGTRLLYALRAALRAARAGVIKNKNKLYISAKRNRISNEIYKNYKIRLSHLLNVSEKQYYQESLDKHLSNMRKTWEIIKMVINKNKNKTTNSEFLVNNRLTTDKTKVVNGFNKYFVSVGATLAKAMAKPNVSPMHFIQQTVMETFLY